jgi:hypothetical protein
LGLFPSGKRLSTKRVLSILACIGLFTACAGINPVSQTVTTPTNSLGAVTSVTNTVVNTNNLANDCADLEALSAGACTLTLALDKSALPIFQDYVNAESQIINGANSNTASQVLSAFGKSSNTILNNAIAPLVSLANAREQALLAKYGPTIAGQIAIAITKAIGTGFLSALSLQPQSMIDRLRASEALWPETRILHIDLN